MKIKAKEMCRLKNGNILVMISLIGCRGDKFSQPAQHLEVIYNACEFLAGSERLVVILENQVLVALQSPGRIGYLLHDSGYVPAVKA